MKIYSLHFSIKHVTPKQVRDTVAKFIPKGIGILFHGFMTREVVEAKGFDTEWVDLFDEIAPNKVSFFNPVSFQTEREKLIDCIDAGDGISIFIGPVVDGVKEEMEIGKGRLKGVIYDPKKKVTTDLF